MAERKSNKPTERDMYNRIKSLIEDTEILDFCDKKIAQLDKKHSKVDEGKVAQDKVFTDKIRDILFKAGHKMSIAEIKSADNELLMLSSSKMSYLLRSMDDVQNTHDKKVSYYELV